MESRSWSEIERERLNAIEAWDVEIQRRADIPQERLDTSTIAPASPSPED